MKQKIFSTSVLGILILLSSGLVSATAAYAEAAPTAEETPEPNLDSSYMEFHPILEVEIPQKAAVDQRFVVITNKEGQMTGIGLDGAWGSPWDAGLRASLSDVRNGKDLQYAWGDKPFMKIEGKYFNTNGGVMKISSPDGKLSKYVRIYKDHGVWRVQEVKWQGNDWVDLGMINDVRIDAGFSLLKMTPYVKQITMSRQGSAIERWKKLMSEKGMYSTFQLNPTVDPAPASIPATSIATTRPSH